MTSRSRSGDRSLRDSRSRSRSQSRSHRSLTPRSDGSRSPSPDRRHTPDRDSRGRSPRRNGGRDRSRSYSRDGSYYSRSRSRTRSESPSLKSTKIVVERLTKNVNEAHLREIFGQFGEIEDLDLPLNRQSHTNRGTAYILYVRESDAEAAIAHMHEAQLDGAMINVSIVLPRRKLSPSPPTARRGANFDPRHPPPGSGRPPPGAPFGGHGPGSGRGRRSPIASAAGSSRYGPRSDTYRPRSVSRSRSRSRSPLPAGTTSRRYRSRSKSHSSRSRSRSQPIRGGRGGRGGRSARAYDDRDRRPSPNRASYDRRSRSRSRDWDRR